MIVYSNIYNDTNKILVDKLPDYLIYHNMDHINYVIEKAVLIAKNEGIDSEEMDIIKIAALFHDIGFIKSRVNHEEVGCSIAKESLTRYGLTEKEIDKVCSMIMATKIPQQPGNHLDKILADADLEYLGTDNFDAISERLFEELLYFNPDLSREEWYRLQIDFLSAHRYHTDFCKKFRENKKSQNLENIIQKFKCLSLNSNEKASKNRGF